MGIEPFPLVLAVLILICKASEIFFVSEYLIGYKHIIYLKMLFRAYIDDPTLAVSLL